MELEEFVNGAEGACSANNVVDGRVPQGLQPLLADFSGVMRWAKSKLVLTCIGTRSTRNDKRSGAKHKPFECHKLDSYWQDVLNGFWNDVHQDMGWDAPVSEKQMLPRVVGLALLQLQDANASALVPRSLCVKIQYCFFLLQF